MTSHKSDVFLGLGSNIGDRSLNLKLAREAVELSIGRIIQASAVYLTAPWGMSEQPPFYNQVIRVKTSMEPENLLSRIQEIEKKMGRERIVKWDKRIIDIDILFYDRLVYQSDRLQIPHPWLERRNFVLVPLAEIAPEWVHPVLHKPIRELLEISPDTLEVKPLEL